MHSVYKLKGVVQHYSWGGKDFIPNLIGTTNNDSKPFAEYWLGAHPNCPSLLLNGGELSLCDAIKTSAEEILGKRVQQQFGSLPYLFKILDVKQMLSIQVHPSLSSAIKGYAEENEKGIPVNAPNRNYKDENHKPELMAALGDFWLLHGFKDEAGIYKIFEKAPELCFLRKEFEQEGYKALYETVMTMPQEKVDEVLSPLMQKIVPQYKAGEFQKSDEHFWAARAALTFCKNDCYDRGIFSIYFFNLLHLKEGEGIYQPAGLPHAYLEGQNVEVMANSDNVLRAGLTDKHIDVPELMKHVRFEPTIPKIIPAKQEKEQVYVSPAAEFLLTKYNLTTTLELSTESATIIFLYEGKMQVDSSDKSIDLNRGEVAMVLAGKRFSLKPLSGGATVFTVTTPKQ